MQKGRPRKIPADLPPLPGIDTCHECGADNVHVKDSRRAPDGRRRRRFCSACGCRWTTIERPIGSAADETYLKRAQAYAIKYFAKEITEFMNRKAQENIAN